ncbi:hypothetical protein R1sor_022642 [Riccia sorocarpa]|uniref:Uncharacterized protein n=1 Tax=Riccia sorocarpa TaxID=122646 RepID=A0ABD3GLZ1_9MARC
MGQVAEYSAANSSGVVKTTPGPNGGSQPRAKTPEGARCPMPRGGWTNPDVTNTPKYPPGFQAWSGKVFGWLNYPFRHEQEKTGEAVVPAHEAVPVVGESDKEFTTVLPKRKAHSSSAALKNMAGSTSDTNRYVVLGEDDPDGVVNSADSSEDGENLDTAMSDEKLKSTGESVPDSLADPLENQKVIEDEILILSTDNIGLRNPVEGLLHSAQGCI